MYDWLLFLHVLAAFAMGATVVMFSALALGAVAAPRVVSTANVLWDVGGIGTLVFGIWLAIDVDGYEIWDGWILGAIVVWAIAAELGRRAKNELAPAASADANGVREAAVVPAKRPVLMHWLRAVAVVALLALMIFKPGA